MCLLALAGCAEKIDWDNDAAYDTTNPKVAELEARIAELEKQVANLVRNPGPLPTKNLQLNPVAQASSSSGSNGDAQKPAVEEEKELPLYLGNLTSPFTAMPLDELEANVKQQGGWIDQPVMNSEDHLREYLNSKPAPTTVEEALKLKNTDDKTNDAIRYTLGRLPEDEKNEVDYEATMTRHSNVDVKSVNPIMMSTTMEFDIAGLTSFGILSLRYDNMKMYAPADTIVSWQTSPDRLFDKFVLRDDLVWSDGQPITAHDIEFSYKVIMTQQVPTPAMRSGTDELLSVKAYDDRTLVFFHKESLATNVANMMFSIIPKHIYEKSVLKDPSMQELAYHIKYEKEPVVGGPYKITKRVQEQTIELEAREDYYMYKGKQVRSKPYYKKIRYQIIPAQEVALMALKRGDLDYLSLNFEQWQSQTEGADFYQRCTKIQAPEWTSFHFAWNMKSPFFSDKRVRQAMSYAFDYQEMFDTILFHLAQPSFGIFHPLNPAFPKNAKPAFAQDLDKAQQLLDEAGWKDSDGDGIRDKMIDGKKVPFDFTLLVPSANANGMKICELMRQCLQAIGVSCNVRPIEFTVLVQKTQSHEFEASFAGWGAGADPDTTKNIWQTNADRNYCQYSNAEVDELFGQGMREFDQEKRMAIYGRIHSIIFEDQPYTFLFCRNAFYGFNKSLRGYGFYPRGLVDGGIWRPKAVAE